MSSLTGEGFVVLNYHTHPPKRKRDQTMLDLIFALVVIPTTLITTIAWTIYAYRKGLI